MKWTAGRVSLLFFAGFASALAAQTISSFSQELSFDGANAFRLHREGMNSSDVADFNYGRGLFHHFWEPVEYDDGTTSGFGPLYNANACVACHINDGRGRPPEPGNPDTTSFVLRLSTGSKNIDGYQSVIPDPTYGFQFQDRAILDLPGEGRIITSYSQTEVQLRGGQVVSLRQPAYELSELAYGPLSTDLSLGPRIAPPLIGLGLLEQIPLSAMLANEDANDLNNDGISGRINWGPPNQDGESLPGRFGWKLTTVSVREQSDNAANADMGISTPLVDRLAGDCTQKQDACISSARAEHFGKSTELAENEMRLLAFYTANLAVPPRRNEQDTDVLAGEALFGTLGCAACHTPAQTLESGEQIAPYTDLLLHDMGEGLADGIVVGNANEREWRTPPLWGIGLTEQVSGHTFFLHDGRARNLTEAIMWHGGEGTNARDGFSNLEPTERQSLLAFLNSL